MEDWGISPNAYGGAAALIYSHLELLSSIEIEIGLTILKKGNQSLGFDSFCQMQPDIWQKVRSWCIQIDIIQLDAPSHPATPLLFQGIRAIHAPTAYLYGGFLSGKGTDNLIKSIQNFSPDFIWAEHLFPASLLMLLPIKAPIIYSHHDWHWKIKSYRAESQAKSNKQRIRKWLMKRHEIKLVRRASACVGGSYTELIEMQKIGAKKTGYFPTTYQMLTLDFDAVQLENPPRIVHLGGIQTTANRLGLLRFLQVCWDELTNSLSPAPELWVIGNLDGAPPELMRRLQHERITCTGMVPDLTTVLRPFDIHIIPWEYDTGTRTRIPLVLNHAQVLLSTRAAAACLPELEDNKNCVLAQDLLAMANALMSLYNNPEQRKRIALQGFQDFRKNFTQQAQQPRLDKFVRELLPSSKIDLIKGLLK